MADNEGTVGQADALILNAAADALYRDEPLPEGAAILVANILRAEAMFIETAPGIVNLFSITLQQVSDGKASIAMQRTENGDMRLKFDNTTNTVNLARHILNHQES